MAMPSGDSSQKAEEFYNYLLAHHETEHPVKTWHVEWYSLAWMWGFLAALSLIQASEYHSTCHVFTGCSDS